MRLLKFSDDALRSSALYGIPQGLTRAMTILLSGFVVSETWIFFKRRTLISILPKPYWYTIRILIDASNNTALTLGRPESFQAIQSIVKFQEI